MLSDDEITQAAAALRAAGEQRGTGLSAETLRQRAERRTARRWASALAVIAALTWVAADVVRPDARVQFADSGPSPLRRADTGDVARTPIEALQGYLPTASSSSTHVVVTTPSAVNLFQLDAAGRVTDQRPVDAPLYAGQSPTVAPPHTERDGTVVAYDDRDAQDGPVTRVRLSLLGDGEVWVDTADVDEGGPHLVDDNGRWLDVVDVGRGSGVEMLVGWRHVDLVPVESQQGLVPLTPHPDGGFLVSEADGLRRVLASGGSMPADVPWHRAAWSAAFSPTGLFAVGTTDNTVNVVTREGEVIKLDALPRGRATALSFLGSGRGLLVTQTGRTADNSGVFSCELSSLECQRVLPHEPEQYAVAFTADLASSATNTPNTDAFCAQYLVVTEDEAKSPTEAEMEDLQAVSASTIRASVDELVGRLEDGDWSSEAMERIDRYAADTCAAEQLTVTGTEYRFEGMARTLPSGRAALRFTNAGAETHELILQYREPAESRSFDRLEEDPGDALDPTIAYLHAAPGETDTQVFDFQPGNYRMLCQVPKGTTPEYLRDTGRPPYAALHDRLGMVHRFTVG